MAISFTETWRLDSVNFVLPLLALIQAFWNNIWNLFIQRRIDAALVRSLLGKRLIWMDIPNAAWKGTVIQNQWSFRKLSNFRVPKSKKSRLNSIYICTLKPIKKYTYYLHWIKWIAENFSCTSMYESFDILNITGIYFLGFSQTISKW